MSKYRNVLLVFLLFVCTDIVLAQEQRHSIKLYFRQGDTKIDASYKTNAAELKILDSLISVTKRDSILAIEKFEFRSGVSPEGGLDINKQIVMGRLMAISKVVKQKILLPDSVIDMRPNHTDWSLLRELVAKSTMQYRTEVLYIIDNVPEQVYDKRGNWVDGRRKRLMNLKGGKPYNYLFDNFFPMMRYAVSTLTLYFREPTPEEKKQMVVVEEPIKEEPVVKTVVDTVKVESIVPPIIKERKPFYMTLSSNMLYDGLLVPNIGV